MQDFTAGNIAATPDKTQTSGDQSLDARIRELVATSGCTKSCALIEEMIITALKMGRDQTTTADLKLFNRALKEMRYAARVFAPYRHTRKIVVFGSARTDPAAPEALAAEAFARQMVQQDYMIITGGGDGIMGAAQRGAGRENSFGLNIRLPFEQSANPTIHGDAKLVNFNYFFTRKLNFVKESHGVALFPGGFGTMDEGFELLTLMQTGKARILPAVFIDRPGGTYWETWRRFLRDNLLHLGLISEDDFRLIHFTHSVEEAVQHFTDFYRNFRSYRWVGPRMVIRLTRRLTAGAVQQLNTQFDELLKAGEIVQTTALPEEANEPELAAYPRIVLTPHQRNFGVLRTLIDAINASEEEA